jgi:hypothetical protein
VTPLGLIAPAAGPAPPGIQIAEGAAALPAVPVDDAMLQRESFDILLAAMVDEDGAEVAPPSPQFGRELLVMVEGVSLRPEVDAAPVPDAEGPVLDPLAAALLIPITPMQPPAPEQTAPVTGDVRAEASRHDRMAPISSEEVPPDEGAAAAVVEFAEPPAAVVALPATPRLDTAEQSPAGYSSTQATVEVEPPLELLGVSGEVGAPRSQPSADTRGAEAAPDDAPRETPGMLRGTPPDLDTDDSISVAVPRRAGVVSGAPAVKPQPEGMPEELPRKLIPDASAAPDTGPPVERSAAAVRMFDTQAHEQVESSGEAHGDPAVPNAMTTTAGAMTTTAGARTVEAHPAGHPPAQPAAAVAAVTPQAPVLTSAAASLLSSDVQPAASPEAENIARLVQAMRVAAQSGRWEATVRLKPEHLGEVTIAVRVQGHSVSAIVNAEAAGVRQWLQSQEESVRAGLADQGLLLERFVVTRDGQQRRQPEQRPQQPRVLNRPRGEERFEVVV